jgi:hypothetical protein
MAAISLSINRGTGGFKISDITVGTSAPGTGDIELRFNTQDTNSVNLTRKDLFIALEAFERAFEQGQLITTTPIL